MRVSVTRVMVEVSMSLMFGATCWYVASSSSTAMPCQPLLPLNEDRHFARALSASAWLLSRRFTFRMPAGTPALAKYARRNVTVAVSRLTYFEATCSGDSP